MTFPNQKKNIPANFWQSWKPKSLSGKRSSGITKTRIQPISSAPGSKDRYHDYLLVEATLWKILVKMGSWFIFPIFWGEHEKNIWNHFLDFCCKAIFIFVTVTTKRIVACQQSPFHFLILGIMSQTCLNRVIFLNLFMFFWEFSERSKCPPPRILICCTF